MNRQKKEKEKKNNSNNNKARTHARTHTRTHTHTHHKNKTKNNTTHTQTNFSPLFEDAQTQYPMEALVHDNYGTQREQRWTRQGLRADNLPQSHNLLSLI
jgi:hypothetical protein